MSKLVTYTKSFHSMSHAGLAEQINGLTSALDSTKGERVVSISYDKGWFEVYGMVQYVCEEFERVQGGTVVEDGQDAIGPLLIGMMLILVFFAGLQLYWIFS